MSRVSSTSRSYNRIILICLTICLALIVPVVSLASGTIEGISSNGQIDWEQGVIIVKGNGAPPQNIPTAQGKLMAKAAAKTDAYRNALEIIEGVRVKSETYVKDFVAQSDEIRTSVQGMIKGAQITETVYDLDNACEVTMVVPLTGRDGLTKLLADTVRKAAEQQPSVNPQVINAISQIDPAKEIQSKSYTGLVIDARGLGVKPAMYPQVWDSKGSLIYGPLKVDIDRLGFNTLAAYSRSLVKAQTLSRVGPNPLVIPAISSVKDKNGEATDVVISSENGMSILKNDTYNKLLAAAAVVIVID